MRCLSKVHKQHNQFMQKTHLTSTTVQVRTAARLHLGFLDMHGGLGRKFGSLGLAISGIDTTLVADYADDINVLGDSSERASHYAEQILSHFGIDGGVKMQIQSAIPTHIGLGSGTQLSLAIATAITKLYGLPAQQPMHLASLLHRGARSGIGIGTFGYGGFIVDAGRGGDTVIPPVISHLSFPEHWRILIVFDDGVQGICGNPERRIFNTLTPMPEATSGLLSRLTLMQVLPAISEHNCHQFGQAITQIQTIIGDYFSKAQGGRYSSPFLNAILTALTDVGATGIGQSSWGPTGFAFFANETTAFQALKKIRADWRHKPRLRFMMSQACNMPANISVTQTETNESIIDSALSN